jgi:NAD(P)H-dependent FMN reductase
MLNIAIVIGSVRTGRQSHKAAYYLEKKFNERKDVSVKVIDLKEYDIPLFEGLFAYHPNPGESLKKAAETLKNADAIILHSPEYHAGISGVLKNFIDYFHSEITKKPIGVVTASSGKFGGINASNQMQQVIFGLGSFPMPKKFIVPFVSQAFDDEYNSQNEEITKSAETFIDEFIWFSNTITNGKAVSTKAAA